MAVQYVGEAIYIVLDNARYQKCLKVQETACKLGIHLVYISAYSPNLNLIERLWKHVKDRLRIKCYESFDLFTEKIDSIICAAATTDKKVVDKLISDKVQLYDDIAYELKPVVASFKTTIKKVA